MNNQSLILINRDHPHITLLTLNRPEKRNALNIELMTQLCDHIEQIASDSSQRVIIINGAGPVFCAGLDLSLNDVEKSSELVQRMLKTVYTCPLVTIAAVHGGAYAGGAGLMMACDFTIAAEETLFAFPETRRGLVPAQVMVFLIRQLQQRDLRELVLFGESIDADEAWGIGMVNKVVDEKYLIEEALRYAQYAIQGGPKATVMTKRLIDEMYPSDFTTEQKMLSEYHEQARRSPEAKEGIQAFLEKREPHW